MTILLLENKVAWADWLNGNYDTSLGIWLRLAKKSAITGSVTYMEAIDVALCYGWIDGQKRPESEHYWLQKFSPRAAKSIWSKINRDKALGLIATGHMMAAGLKEIERAKNDGRWDAAYEGASKATVPADLQLALDANPKAKAFFKILNSQNRYAILFRTQTAKKPETRAKRIQQFIEMLAKNEKLYP